MKQQLSEQVLENYKEATIELFMECYFAEAMNGACKQADAEPADVPFSQELDARCRALIQRECRKSRLRRQLRSAKKLLCAAAMLAIALCTTACILFVCVEAIRKPIINYYISRTDSYWEIAGINSDTAVPSTTFNLEDPLEGLIPEDYQLQLLNGNSLNFLTAIYRNTSDEEIFFTANALDGIARIDIENADTTYSSVIFDRETVVIIKDRLVRIAWINEEIGIQFSLQTTGLSEEDALEIATVLISKK